MGFAWTRCELQFFYLHKNRKKIIINFIGFTTDSLLHPILSDWYMAQEIQKEITSEDIGKWNIEI
jgi:hypothetical protein